MKNIPTRAEDRGPHRMLPGLGRWWNLKHEANFPGSLMCKDPAFVTVVAQVPSQPGDCPLGTTLPYAMGVAKKIP